MLSIVNANYVDGYKVELQFSDNRKGCVDLTDFIKNTELKPFKNLLDMDVFKEFKLDYTLTWSEDLDIAPEFLYYEAFKNDVDLKPTFKGWGYI